MESAEYMTRCERTLSNIRRRCGDEAEEVRLQMCAYRTQLLLLQQEFDTATIKIKRQAELLLQLQHKHDDIEYWISERESHLSRMNSNEKEPLVKRMELLECAKCMQFELKHPPPGLLDLQVTVYAFKEEFPEGCLDMFKKQSHNWKPRVL